MISSVVIGGQYNKVPSSIMHGETLVTVVETLDYAPPKYQTYCYICLGEEPDVLMALKLSLILM